MTITFPHDPPSLPVARSVRFAPESVVASTSSPFTLQDEVFEHQGQRWVVDVQLPPMQRAAAAQWNAWALALNGMRGTFRIGPVVETSPLGTGNGTPVVDGAGQQGSKTLVTRGWAALEKVLLAGDYIQLGSTTARLHMVLQDVTADSSGDATIDIWPRVRDVLTDGAAITLNNPRGTFRLASMPGWDLTEAQIYGISYRAMEADI